MYSVPDGGRDRAGSPCQRLMVQHWLLSLHPAVGIAPNRMLAKICSDMNKPNGEQGGGWAGPLLAVHSLLCCGQLH